QANYFAVYAAEVQGFLAGGSACGHVEHSVFAEGDSSATCVLLPFTREQLLYLSDLFAVKLAARYGDGEFRLLFLVTGLNLVIGEIDKVVGCEVWMKQDVLQSAAPKARYFGQTLHGFGIHPGTRARSVVDQLETIATLDQQSVAVLKERDAERMH